jgi:hypothetical protein
MKLKDILNPKPIIESNVKVGNMYMVHGYPLLKGLFPNKYYKIHSIDGDNVTLQQVNQQGQITNLSNAPVTHKLSSIQASIQSIGNGDANGLEDVDESIKENNKMKLKDVLKESAGFNKKIKSDLDSYLKDFKEGTPTHQWAVKEILKSALTDANFHKEAKKVDSIFSRAKYEEDSAKEKSYQNAVERKGREIASKAKWDGHEIIDAISFYTSMTIGHPLGQKVTSLKENVVNEDEKWIQKAIDPKKKGQLHKDLGIPQDDTIPVSKLKAAAEKGGVVGKRAQFALNVRGESKLTLKGAMNEAKFPVYHKTYTSAINSALDWVEKMGYEYDKEETAREIGMGPRKPSEGKTNRFSISLTKKGKPVKQHLQIQVYNMGTFKRNSDGSKTRSMWGGQNEFELNCYIG